MCNIICVPGEFEVSILGDIRWALSGEFESLRTAFSGH